MNPFTWLKGAMDSKETQQGSQYKTLRRDPMNGGYHPLDMLYMRLFPRQMHIEVPFIQVYWSDKKAFVFVVVNDKAITLEDDPHLFPSDRIVTSIRLLLGVTQ